MQGRRLLLAGAVRDWVPEENREEGDTEDNLWFCRPPRGPHVQIARERG